MKELASKIYEVANTGKLKQPFNAAMVGKACLGWAPNTYFTFLGKHAVGNGVTTELFKRVERGFYRIRNST